MDNGRITKELKELQDGVRNVSWGSDRQRKAAVRPAAWRVDGG